MYEYNFPKPRKQLTKRSSRQAHSFEILEVCEDLCQELFRFDNSPAQIKFALAIVSMGEKLLRSYPPAAVNQAYHEYLREHEDDWEEDA